MEVKGALEEMLQASFGRKKGALQTQKKKKKVTQTVVVIKH